MLWMTRALTNGQANMTGQVAIDNGARKRFTTCLRRSKRSGIGQVDQAHAGSASKEAAPARAIVIVVYLASRVSLRCDGDATAR